MTKKNLVDTALKYEIYHNIEETLDVLIQLNLVEKSEFFVESTALCWLENEPSEQEKTAVLKELGYNL